MFMAGQGNIGSDFLPRQDDRDPKPDTLPLRAMAKPRLLRVRKLGPEQYHLERVRIFIENQVNAF